MLKRTEATVNNSTEGDANLETKLTLQVQLKKKNLNIFKIRGVKARCFALNFDGPNRVRNQQGIFFNMEAKNITENEQLLQEIESFIRNYAIQNMLVHMNA